MGVFVRQSGLIRHLRGLHLSTDELGFELVELLLGLLISSVIVVPPWIVVIIAQHAVSARRATVSVQHCLEGDDLLLEGFNFQGGVFQIASRIASELPPTAILSVVKSQG